MNNKGMTMIYVIALMIVVGFIGTSMIKMATSDNINRIYYNQSQRATSMSKSAICYGVSYLEDPNNKDTILKYLQIFIDSNTPTSFDITKGYYAVTPRDSIKVSIDAFDPDNFNVRFRVYARSHGARSDAYGVYNIKGLGYKTTQVVTPIEMAAFKLSGNTDFESNCDVTVEGFTYITGKLTTNSSKFLFTGPFYQDKSSTETIINGGSIVFEDNAYLGSHWSLSSGTTIKFEKKVGFEGGIQGHASKPYFGGNIYHNGRHTTNWTNAGLHMDWDKYWDAKGHDVYSVSSVYTNGKFKDSYIDRILKNGGSYYVESSPMDLVDSTDMPEIPNDLTIDWSKINSVTTYYTKSHPHITTGADINNIYTMAYNAGDTLCGGFVVIREHSSWNGFPSSMVIKDDGTKISGKIIYISTLSHDLKMFPSTNSSGNVILICNTSNATTQFGVGYLRGILYVTGKGLQFQPKNPTIIDGATYYAPSAHHYNNSGGGVIYRYNQSVLAESACMGVITDGSSSSNTTTNTKQLEYKDAVLKCKFLSVAY